MAQDGKDEKETEFASIRVFRESARRLAMVAQYRGESVAETLDRVCGATLDRELKKVVAEMTVELGGEG